jgi:hypothetical protein
MSSEARYLKQMTRSPEKKNPQLVGLGSECIYCKERRDNFFKTVNVKIRCLYDSKVDYFFYFFITRKDKRDDFEHSVHSFPRKDCGRSVVAWLHQTMRVGCRYKSVASPCGLTATIHDVTGSWDHIN